MTIFTTFLRRLLGLVCLILAFIGFVLPIIPGWPFIVPAVILLGRRDPLLRWMNLTVRRALRWLRRSERPLLHMIGMRLSLEYARGRRSMMPKVIELERRFAGM